MLVGRSHPTPHPPLVGHLHQTADGTTKTEVQLVNTAWGGPTVLRTKGHGDDGDEYQLGLYADAYIEWTRSYVRKDALVDGVLDGAHAHVEAGDVDPLTVDARVVVVAPVRLDALAGVNR